ncbi:type IV pilus biogenesis/stability protein PilW [Stenotrophomonas lactitubi]|uniref:tetratricopeptide repeat protein n=1 Tax=Stenotrophomonas lactitubi TaxID=2045214 RepID=UPI0035C0212B
MRKYFESLIEKLQLIESDVEARVVWVSSTRHLVQVLDYCLIEWIASESKSPEHQPPRETLQALYCAADGALVEALDVLAVAAERCGWQGVYRPLLESIPEHDGAAALCASQPKSLQGLLRATVELRNDGGEGHGLPGGYQRKEEEAAFAFIVSSLGALLPVLGEDGGLAFGPIERRAHVKMIKVVDGKPVLIRSIQSISSSLIRVKAKYYDAGWELRELSYEAANPFSKFEDRSLPALTVFNNSWSPLCYIPSRITDTFTARRDEIAEIIDWMDDVESRACLVFGDGGVGKTTLVVEALHRLLEEDLQTEWKPRLITFFTAKRTQFDLDGISPVGMGNPSLHGLMIHLHKLLLGRVPDADFYKKDVGAAAVYLQSVMGDELSIKRKEHLLVIDNAETLIESDRDRELLGKEIREISRRVGRVVVTSRRREHLGAEPVEVHPLGALDAVSFLKQRGAEKLNIRALKNAKDHELLGVVGELERRPIVLDSLIGVLQDPAYDTLNKAKARVLSMLARDLGKFLFADAWTRLSQPVQRLLVLMTRVADVHDAQLLRICGDVAGVSVQDAEKALEESSGIASVVHLDGGIQVSFSKNFLDFCKGRDCRDGDVTSALSKYRAFLARARSFSGDRIAAAFRTPQARAAHKYRNERNLIEAEKLYEQAILADPMNGLLYDRYAYFLAQDMKKPQEALHKAGRATELLPSEAEVWFTRGLIESRMGNVRGAKISLEKAERLGFSPLRCAIQMCWAYVLTKPRQLALAKSHYISVTSRAANLDPSSKEAIEIRRLELRLQTD